MVKLISVLMVFILLLTACSSPSVPIDEQPEINEPGLSGPSEPISSNQEETEEKPSARPIRPVWGGGNKVTIIDGREEEKNPGTGAPVFEISSAITVLSTTAVICFRKKK